MRSILNFLKNGEGEVSIGYGLGYCIVGGAVLGLFFALSGDFTGFYDTVTEVMRSAYG
jgi:Flp pilus assembly pilin Flp